MEIESEKLMAKILPFKAWRYNDELSKDIGELASPLFDVISEKQRKALYDQPYNSIHLSVPLQGETAQQAHQTLDQWKAEGILKQDPLPGIYVYYHYFRLSGESKEYVRKGFISFIKALSWDDETPVIMRHENTIPHSVNDRIEVLEETQLNVSPTHGLYFDKDYELEEYMDACIENPIYSSEDYQGVRDVLGVIHDHSIIKKFIAKLADQKIILADGHHRYESSMVYREKRKSFNPEHTGMEAYNYHLMYLTNGESDDLRILPTHRLISGIGNFDRASFLETLSEYFMIKPVNNPNDITEVILGKKWAFGLLFDDEAFKIRLKPEAHRLLSWNFPDEINDLDLTVMHYFVIEKGLGIAGKNQRKSEHIGFERNFANCLTATIRGEAQFAIITQDVSMEDVKKVCYSGYTLPQKSTYFYPKVICGYLFGSIKQDEFELPFDIGF